MGKINKNLVISADDFGISQRASSNILNLVRIGKIDRVEVMMSRNISTEYVRELLASDVKLDVHLHLAKNKLDFWQEHQRRIEDGALVRGVKFLLKYILGITSAKKIEKEWESQIESFIKIFGKVPDGTSSHEYIHFFPPYFKRLLWLCKKYDISYVRYGKEDSVTYSSIAKILNWLRSKNFENFKESKINSADLMISFDWVGDLDLILRQYDAAKIKEVVFHPEKSNEYVILENLIESR